MSSLGAAAKNDCAPQISETTLAMQQSLVAVCVACVLCVVVSVGASKLNPYLQETEIFGPDVQEYVQQLQSQIRDGLKLTKLQSVGRHADVGMLMSA